ncbi:hypothetical protein VNO77_22839 [Canavalia gladiata]|uniref:Uncharacterized protein n=1 Tax=Canavalia gladiata TaxID=3824 RepID=A0AAN9L3I3_CANGL
MKRGKEKGELSIPVTEIQIALARRSTARGRGSTPLVSAGALFRSHSRGITLGIRVTIYLTRHVTIRALVKTRLEGVLCKEPYRFMRVLDYVKSVKEKIGPDYGSPGELQARADWELIYDPCFHNDVE